MQIVNYVWIQQVYLTTQCIAIVSMKSLVHHQYIVIEASECELSPVHFQTRCTVKLLSVSCIPRCREARAVDIIDQLSTTFKICLCTMNIENFLDYLYQLYWQRILKESWRKKIRSIIGRFVRVWSIILETLQATLKMVSHTSEACKSLRLYVCKQDLAVWHSPCIMRWLLTLTEPARVKKSEPTGESLQCPVWVWHALWPSGKPPECSCIALPYCSNSVCFSQHVAASIYASTILCVQA